MRRRGFYLCVNRGRRGMGKSGQGFGFVVWFVLGFAG